MKSLYMHSIKLIELDKNGYDLTKSRDFDFDCHV